MPNTREAKLPSALPVPSDNHLGQGTAVEMSRAVAEVHAAMYAARQFPRDVAVAIREMENSCGQPYVAERAFFRIKRSRSAVTGPTVHLARELARCWGHIQYGIIEMRRDVERRQSEMQAFAWDVQTGTRVVHTFIQPHQRDKKDEETGKPVPENLTSLQDIYESNSNAGARRVRECIFGVLPPWFTETAKGLCQKTLEKGDGTPLSARAENAVAAFAKIGVGVDQLERKLGLPRIRWTGRELGLLVTVHRSLDRGETTVADEFPVGSAVTAGEILGATPAPSLRQDVPPAVGDAQKMTETQRRQMFVLFNDLTLGGEQNRDKRLKVTGEIVGRRVASSTELTEAEASALIDQLQKMKNDPDGALQVADLLAGPFEGEEGEAQ